MKKRFYLFVPALVLGTGLMIGSSTFALFSANASNSNNTFSAGTLNIRLDHQDTDTPKVAYFTISNMAPGDSQVQPVTVSSTGSLALQYKFSVTLNGYLANHDDNHLGYQVFSSQADADAGTNPIDLTQYRLLDAQGGAHDHETLYVKVNLPLNANNEYQQQSGTAVISVNAVQTRNNSTNSFADLNWSASGPGTSSVVKGVPDPNSVEFSYSDRSSNEYYGEQWNFTNSTIATKSETINFNYHYWGIHSWYDASAQAQVYVDGPNGRQYITLWDSPVYDNFDHSGSASIQVNQGYSYGFILGGANFDSSQIMDGHFTITRTN